MNITKGEWQAKENDYYIDIMVDGNPIAQITVNQFVDTDKDVMRANASLIECAPKMRETLEEIHDAMAGNGEYGEFYYEVKNLLAKARGEK